MVALVNISAFASTQDLAKAITMLDYDRSDDIHSLMVLTPLHDSVLPTDSHEGSPHFAVRVAAIAENIAARA
jgi:hypothetical protein